MPYFVVLVFYVIGFWILPDKKYLHSSIEESLARVVNGCN